MKTPTHTDVVASSMRNAVADSLDPKKIFSMSEREYDIWDANLLETCYKAVEMLQDEKVEEYYQFIASGYEMYYDSTGEFVMI